PISVKTISHTPTFTDEKKLQIRSSQSFSAFCERRGAPSYLISSGLFSSLTCANLRYQRLVPSGMGAPPHDRINLRMAESIYPSVMPPSFTSFTIPEASMKNVVG